MPNSIPPITVVQQARDFTLPINHERVDQPAAQAKADSTVRRMTAAIETSLRNGTNKASVTVDSSDSRKHGKLDAFTQAAAVGEVRRQLQAAGYPVNVDTYQPAHAESCPKLTVEF